MPIHGEAKAAMKALNGKELDGNKIRVKKVEIKVMIEEDNNIENKKGSILNKYKNIPGKSIWSKRT